MGTQQDGNSWVRACSGTSASAASAQSACERSLSIPIAVDTEGCVGVVLGACTDTGIPGSSGTTVYMKIDQVVAPSAAPPSPPVSSSSSNDDTMIYVGVSIAAAVLLIVIIGGLICRQFSSDKAPSDDSAWRAYGAAADTKSTTTHESNTSAEDDKL